MPGNEDHAGLVPVRRSDGSLLDRRTWPETVSTLTPDLLGECPVQARLKPAAGQHDLPDTRPRSARQPANVAEYATADDRRTTHHRPTRPRATGRHFAALNRSVKDLT
jgi:hypothetical protein